jgi:hypothetical protein
MSLCLLDYTNNDFILFPKMKRNLKEVVNFIILRKTHQKLLNFILKLNQLLYGVIYKRKVILLSFKFFDNNLKYFYYTESVIKAMKQKIFQFSYAFENNVFYQKLKIKYSSKCNLDECSMLSDGLYNLCKDCKPKKYTMEKDIGQILNNKLNIGCDGIKLIIFDYIWGPSYVKY